MYVPDSFKIEDEAQLASFMERYDFVTMVSAPASGLVATHLPILLRRDAGGLTLVGHVARANPHGKLMTGALEALVVFQGPHAYVSPSWYAQAPAVPTWNFAVVHAYGRPQAVHDAAFTERVVRELTLRYEGGRPSPWRLDDTPAEFRERLLGAIVAFEMRVDRLEGKYKLGQNRPPEDRAGTIAGLQQDGTTEAIALADFMRAYEGR